MIVPGELGRIRRQQIVNLSMTEVMLILVFMSLAFTFLSRDEDLREVPAIKKELDEVRAENHDLKSEIGQLKAERSWLISEREKLQAENKNLKRQLQELLPDAPPPVANNGPTIAVPEAGFRWLQARVSSLEKSAHELQAENGALRKQIGGGRASVCHVAS
jgi:chromosome segregation ATPase